MTIAELVVKYMADVSEMKGQLANIEQLNRQIQKSADDTAKNINGLTRSVGNLGGMLQNTMGLFASVGLAGLARDLAVTAGRADEMQKVLYVMGKNAGYTREQLDGFEQSVKKMGISTNEARTSITKMIQANIDLSKATQLARAAQDLAVIAGWNSSETLQRLIINIQQADTLGLRFMGVIIDQAEAQRKFAQQTGIVGRELTRQEKTQATLNAVLEESVKLTGAYEEAMNSWTKTSRTTERFVQELKIALGKGLQPQLLSLERAFQEGMDMMANMDQQTLASMGKFTEMVAVVGTVITGLRLMQTVLGGTRTEMAGVVAALVALSNTRFGEEITDFFVNTLSTAPEKLGELQKTLSGIGTAGKDLASYGEALEWGVFGMFFAGKSGWIGLIAKLLTVYGMLKSFQPKSTEEGRSELRELMGMKDMLPSSEIIGARGKAGKEFLQSQMAEMEANQKAMIEKKKELKQQLKDAVHDAGGVVIGDNYLYNNVDGLGGASDEQVNRINVLRKRYEDSEAAEKEYGDRISLIKKQTRNIDRDEKLQADLKEQQEHKDHLMKITGLDEAFSKAKNAKTMDENKKQLEELDKFWTKQVELASRGQKLDTPLKLSMKDLGQILSTVRAEGNPSTIAGNWEQVTKAITSGINSLPVAKLQTMNKELDELRKYTSPGTAEYDERKAVLYEKTMQDRKKVVQNIIKDIAENGEDYFKQFSDEASKYIKEIADKMTDARNKGDFATSSQLEAEFDAAISHRISVIDGFYAQYEKKIRDTYRDEETVHQLLQGLDQERAKSKLEAYRGTYDAIKEMLQSEIGLYDSLQKKADDLIGRISQIKQEAQSAGTKATSDIQQLIASKKGETGGGDSLWSLRNQIEKASQGGRYQEAQSLIEQAKSKFRSAAGGESDMQDIAKLAGDVAKRMKEAEATGLEDQLKQVKDQMLDASINIDKMKSQLQEMSNVMSGLKITLKTDEAIKEVQALKREIDSLQSKEIEISVTRGEKPLTPQEQRLYGRSGGTDFTGATSLPTGYINAPGTGSGEGFTVNEKGDYVKQGETSPLGDITQVGDIFTNTKVSSSEDSAKDMLGMIGGLKEKLTQPMLSPMSSASGPSTEDNRAYDQRQYNFNGGGGVPLPMDIKKILGDLELAIERYQRRSL